MKIPAVQAPPQVQKVENVNVKMRFSNKISWRSAFPSSRNLIHPLQKERMTPKTNRQRLDFGHVEMLARFIVRPRRFLLVQSKRTPESSRQCRQLKPQRTFKHFSMST